ncbi:MAG: M23 family metallopeptidase [Oscillospiraceae bacterium]|nr:M23 family metallopeptidase [Oscillospiraceae bacterium]
MLFKIIKLKQMLIFISLLLIVITLITYISTMVIASTQNKEQDYIKWVEFSPPYALLDKTANLDIESHNENYPVKYNWIELIAYLASKYYGNLNNFKQADLDKLIKDLNSGKTIQELTQGMTLYSYYIESYTAILGGFIGEYQIRNDKGEYEKKYGIKVFSPIAKGFYYTHSDDFGNPRSYGYQREHLGNDLMGSVGTPIIAVETGYVEALGWNQYGGWRIGIRSFDGKRYYYYAHLRKDHPYAENLVEGSIVMAGDVIGYLGMTGYSATENVNNIEVPHLHFGLQLIFNEVQKDGNNQIWIDVFNIVNFLKRNASQVIYNSVTKEYYRKNDFIDENVEI